MEVGRGESYRVANRNSIWSRQVEMYFFTNGISISWTVVGTTVSDVPNLHLPDGNNFSLIPSLVVFSGDPDRSALPASTSFTRRHFVADSARGIAPLHEAYDHVFLTRIAVNTILAWLRCCPALNISTYINIHIFFETAASISAFSWIHAYVILLQEMRDTKRCFGSIRAAATAYLYKHLSGYLGIPCFFVCLSFLLFRSN